MFQFKSKPIQITENHVLCQDGSIWHKINKFEWEQISTYQRQSPQARIITGEYSDEFDLFWSEWSSHIRNTCSKSDTYSKWKKLTSKEHKIATSFVKVYGRSSNEHNYLKRSNTYLSGKIWESHDQIEELTKSIMPPLANIAWSKEIYNQDTGITESARVQVEKFGMSQEEAWRLLNDA